MTGTPSNSGPVVAVVVARAGSKGLPGKNLRLLAGRPCVAWSVEHAMAATSVDRVVVSSDSDEVLQIAHEMGAATHRRSNALATDSARVDDALREAVAWHEQQHGPIAGAALLYGNVPVRPEGLLDRAVTLWRESGCDSVQSYAPVGKYHPLWQVCVDGAGEVTPWQGDRLFGGVYRRQELTPSFVPDGGVILVSRRALFHEIAGLDTAHPHSFLGLAHRGVLNEEGGVVDIDSAHDFAVAEAVLGARLAVATGG